MILCFGIQISYTIRKQNYTRTKHADIRESDRKLQEKSLPLLSVSNFTKTFF